MATKEINYPIVFVDDCTAVELYDNKLELMSYIEPWYVTQEKYFIYDSQGNVLKFLASKDFILGVVLTGEQDKEAALAKMKSYLERLKDNKLDRDVLDSIPTTIEESIIALKEIHKRSIEESLKKKKKWKGWITKLMFWRNASGEGH
jgi:hypothetical protein